MSLSMLILKGLFQYMLQTLHYRCQNIAQATFSVESEHVSCRLYEMGEWNNKNLIFLTLKLPYLLFLKHIMVTYVTYCNRHMLQFT